MLMRGSRAARLCDTSALAAGTKRFVHLSTIAVHGNDAVMSGPIDESTPVAPVAGARPCGPGPL